MPLLEDLLDDIVWVTDEEISEAIVLLLERAKLVVEGAGAVGVAALLAGRAGGSGTAIPILSGGNIDPTMLISVMRHGLTVAGRYLVMRTKLPDRPGELIKLLSLVAEERGNVIAVEHHREGVDVSVSETEIGLTLVTRDEEHCQQLLAAMTERGYAVERSARPTSAEPQRLNEPFRRASRSRRRAARAAHRRRQPSSTLAAMLARMPDSQIVTTGLLGVHAFRPESAQQAERDVQRAGDVTLVALGLLAHVEHLHGALLEQPLQLVELHGHERLGRPTSVT